MPPIYSLDSSFATDPPTPLYSGPAFAPLYGHLWRFIVTTLGGETLTFLDKLASERNVTYLLNRPAVHTGTVPSDSPEINILHTDGYPFLAEGVRLVYGFRRELFAVGSAAPFEQWVLRFGGKLEQITDTAQQDDARTAYTAWDPWRNLMNRAVRQSSISTPAGGIPGDLPGKNGVTYVGKTGDEIAVDLLNNCFAPYDNLVPCFINTPDWEPAQWTGTIETTSVIGATTGPVKDRGINFPRGMSVGEAWQMLTNTGTMDIVLDPLYDPVNVPGALANLSIYIKAGVVQDEAIFAWNEPGRNLTGLSRLLDGTQRANLIQFYNGQGGPPVAEQSDAISDSTYNRYEALQFFPVQTKPDAVEAIAEAQLGFRKNGVETINISPSPDRMPFLFTEWFLGDQCPIYVTGAAFRDRIAVTTVGTMETGYLRIYGIPIDIDDNGSETVREAIVSVAGAN